MTRQRKRDFGLLGTGNCVGEVTRKCMIHGVGLYSLLSVLLSVPFPVSLLLSLACESGAPLQMENLCLGWRQMGESKELLPCLLYFSCLQLKLIRMSKWHILGWYILISFKYDSWESIFYFNKTILFNTDHNKTICEKDCKYILKKSHGSKCEQAQPK